MIYFNYQAITTILCVLVCSVAQLCNCSDGLQSSGIVTKRENGQVGKNMQASELSLALYVRIYLYQHRCGHFTKPSCANKIATPELSICQTKLFARKHATVICEFTTVEYL